MRKNSSVKSKRNRKKKSLSLIPFSPGAWTKGIEKILREHVKDKRRYLSFNDKESDIKSALRHLATLDWPRFFPRRPKAFGIKLKSFLKNESLIKRLAEMLSNQERALELVGRLHGLSPGRVRYWLNEEKKIKHSAYDIIHGRPALFSIPASKSDSDRPLKYSEVRLQNT